MSRDDPGGNDPLSLLGATLALGLATMVAVLVPGRRAASAEPLKVMRHE